MAVAVYLLVFPSRPMCYKCGKRSRIEWFPGRHVFECDKCETERNEMTALLVKANPLKVEATVRFLCQKCVENVEVPASTLGTVIRVNAQTRHISSPNPRIFAVCPECQTVVEISG